MGLHLFVCCFCLVTRPNDHLSLSLSAPLLNGCPPSSTVSPGVPFSLTSPGATCQTRQIVHGSCKRIASFQSLCTSDTPGHFEVSGAPLETLLPVPLRANRHSRWRMFGALVKDDTALTWRSW